MVQFLYFPVNENGLVLLGTAFVRDSLYELS